MGDDTIEKFEKKLEHSRFGSVEITTYIVFDLTVITFARVIIANAKDKKENITVVVSVLYLRKVFDADDHLYHERFVIDTLMIILYSATCFYRINDLTKGMIIRLQFTYSFTCTVRKKTVMVEFSVM